MFLLCAPTLLLKMTSTSGSCWRQCINKASKYRVGSCERKKAISDSHKALNGLIRMYFLRQSYIYLTKTYRGKGVKVTTRRWGLGFQICFEIRQLRFEVASQFSSGLKWPKMTWTLHIKRALLIFRSSGLERIRSLFMCGCADDY